MCRHYNTLCSSANRIFPNVTPRYLCRPRYSNLSTDSCLSPGWYRGLRPNSSGGTRHVYYTFEGSIHALTGGFTLGLRSYERNPSWPSVRLRVLTGATRVPTGISEMPYDWDIVRRQRPTLEIQNPLWLGRLMTLLTDLFIAQRIIRPR